MKYPDFARRFRKAVIYAGAPEGQKALGSFLGVSGTMAWNYLNGEKLPGMPMAIKMSIRLGVSVDWLLTGRGSMPIEEKIPGYENIRSAAHSQRSIPLLNYIQAGHPREVVDDYAPGDGMAQLEVDAQMAEELGPSAFALQIEGDSMEPEFIAGDRIIIDPDVSPRPGDYVVAKLESEQTVTFKRYRSRGIDTDGHEVFELVALNPNYLTIQVNGNNPGYVIGTMIEHRRYRRR